MKVSSSVKNAAPRLPLYAHVATAGYQWVKNIAVNVDKNAKFPSSLTQADRYTAESVMLSEDHREEIDTKL